MPPKSSKQDANIQWGEVETKALVKMFDNGECHPKRSGDKVYLQQFWEMEERRLLVWVVKCGYMKIVPQFWIILYVIIAKSIQNGIQIQMESAPIQMENWV